MQEQKKTIREELEAAMPDVFRVLRETIVNEEVKPELRIKCCEIVLDRVYGKTCPPEEDGVGGGAVVLTGVNEIAE